MKIRIRNWHQHQHYKERRPPWIKLYREILDDPEWHALSGESAKHLIMLWLIASEGDGYLPDSKTLAFRLRISENRVIALLSDCSAWFEEDASTMLAGRYQDARAETETEGETEKSREEAEGQKAPLPSKAKSFPAGFELTTEMTVYASERGLNPYGEFEKFRNYHQAKGSTFKSWTAAWRTWVIKAVEFQAPKPTAASVGATWGKASYSADDIAYYKSIGIEVKK